MSIYTKGKRIKNDNYMQIRGSFEKHSALVSFCKGNTFSKRNLNEVALNK